MDYRLIPVTHAPVLLALLFLCFSTVAASADLASGGEQSAIPESLSQGAASNSAQKEHELHHIGLLEPLEGPAFYEKLGRPDLVEAYRNREQLKNGLKILGGVTTAGGLVLGMAALFSGNDCVSTPSDWCLAPRVSKSSRLTLGLVGLGLVAGGTGMLVAGFVINPNPVDAVEARQLADEYNAKLKDRLGVASEFAPARQYRPPVRISVAPMLSTSTNGIALQLSF